MPIPHGAPAPRILLRSHAYDAILRAIVDGTLKPGEKLNDQELARWLGVSRTPVREALNRLANQGLVTASPGRQTVVSESDPTTIRESVSVAAALHSTAAHEAMPRITDDDIEKMRSANAAFAVAIAAGDADTALAADDLFHGVAINAAANTVLATMLDMVMPTIRRAEHIRFGSLLGEESVPQHTRIIDAFARRDPNAAESAIKENWLTLHDEER